MAKVRTVFYPEEGLKTYVERMVAVEGFKTETAAIEYLVALGMKEHQRINTSGDIDGKITLHE